MSRAFCNPELHSAYLSRLYSPSYLSIEMEKAAVVSYYCLLGLKVLPTALKGAQRLLHTPSTFPS